MRPRRTYLDYIRDILNASEQIQQFIKDMDFADFSAHSGKLPVPVNQALPAPGSRAYFECAG